MIIRINNSCSLDHTLIKSYVWLSHKIWWWHLQFYTDHFVVFYRWFATVFCVDFSFFVPSCQCVFLYISWLFLTHTPGAPFVQSAPCRRSSRHWPGNSCFPGDEITWSVIWSCVRRCVKSRTNRLVNMFQDRDVESSLGTAIWSVLSAPPHLSCHRNSWARNTPMPRADGGSLGESSLRMKNNMSNLVPLS